MNKSAVVAEILGPRLKALPTTVQALAFAPTNIALCKYWGKRDVELNLPVTSSLSISLGSKGAECSIQLSAQAFDVFSMNGTALPLLSSFGQRLTQYLDLFRHDSPPQYYQVDIKLNIPFAAGLASSACGFASLVLALNRFYGWELSNRELSILARLGSGSACRSIVPGFIEWHAGASLDGMDSYGELLPQNWPELCIGLLILDKNQKPLSSREAMERTAATSTLYSVWPSKVHADMGLLKRALSEQNFQLLGETAESNALNMHALMLSAWPPISYALPETTSMMQKVWKLRQEGVAVYFTQDAGPNLKLLFLLKDKAELEQAFESMETIQPQAFATL